MWQSVKRIARAFPQSFGQAISSARSWREVSYSLPASVARGPEGATGAKTREEANESLSAVFIESGGDSPYR
jgi:hypothetical protein